MVQIAVRNAVFRFLLSTASLSCAQITSELSGLGLKNPPHLIRLRTSRDLSSVVPLLPAAHPLTVSVRRAGVPAPAPASAISSV